MMAWKGESRRHSLARKGIKTNIDQDRRFDVSTFVARGEGLSKKLDDLDGLFYTKIDRIDVDIKEFIRYKNEWVEFIYQELSKMGYDEGDIDDMDIETWAIRIILDDLDDDLGLQTGERVEDLSDWIETQTGDKIDTDDIVELIYNSIPLLEPQFKNVIELRDELYLEIEGKLANIGFTDDEIDEMQIHTWASSRVMDNIEDYIGWQRLFDRTDTLESWILDRVRIRDETRFKGSGKIKDIDLPNSNL